MICFIYFILQCYSMQSLHVSAVYLTNCSRTVRRESRQLEIIVINYQFMWHFVINI